MQEQFTFVEEDTTSVDWRIDDHTRTVGRQGIAAARAILESTPMASAA